MDLDRWEKEALEKALADFPFERLEVGGKDAFSTWLKLRAAGRGTPFDHWRRFLPLENGNAV